jgi:hypothetical protein
MLDPSASIHNDIFSTRRYACRPWNRAMPERTEAVKTDAIVVYDDRLSSHAVKNEYCASSSKILLTAVNFPDISSASVQSFTDVHDIVRHHLYGLVQ